jgi:hypothetical protein
LQSIPVYFAVGLMNLISAALVLILSFIFTVQFSLPYKSNRKDRVLIHLWSGVFLQF